MRKISLKTSLLFLFLGFQFSLLAQNVNIPDGDFKTYLLGNLEINLNDDSEIQLEEAETYTGEIDLGSRGISDLTGLESFINITSFSSSGNNFTELDLSMFVYLKSVSVLEYQFLKTMKLPTNSDLIEVHCEARGLTSIDIPYNENLKKLTCTRNSLTTLDVSQLPNLVELKCGESELTTIDLSNNLKLENINAGISKFKYLDLSLLTSLKFAVVYINQIDTLLLPQSPALLKVECGQNNIQVLDVSGCPNLDKLTFSDNDMRYVNMANGNNSNMTSFVGRSVPDLKCIQVDSENYSKSNWVQNVDDVSVFSNDCGFFTGLENTDEIGFEFYPNPVEEYINIDSEETIVNVQIQNVANNTNYSYGDSERVNVTDLKSGVYVLTVTTESQSFTRKFVKN